MTLEELGLNSAADSTTNEVGNLMGGTVSKAVEGAADAQELPNRTPTKPKEGQAEETLADIAKRETEETEVA